MKKNICIVIPTYNERANLERLIPKIFNVTSELKDDFHILVVDDNSPDGTCEYIEDLMKLDPNIHLLLRPCKMGLGTAHRDGLEFAVNKLNSDIVLEMDADLCHNPKYIPDIIAKVKEGYDIVVGSRKIKGGKYENYPLKRKIISSIANGLVKTFAGIKITDATSGYRAYTRKAIIEAKLDQTEFKGFAIMIESIFRAQKAELKIAEVPIIFPDRIKGKSKLSKNEVVGFFGTCMKLMFRRLA